MKGGSCYILAIKTPDSYDMPIMSFAEDYDSEDRYYTWKKHIIETKNLPKVKPASEVTPKFNSV